MSSKAWHDYARSSYQYRQHHKRFQRFVEIHGLACQDCRGMGGEVIPVLDYGQGPFEECGWCEGTGLISPHDRGLWLRCKREESLSRARIETKSHVDTLITRR